MSDTTALGALVACPSCRQDRPAVLLRGDVLHAWRLLHDLGPLELAARLRVDLPLLYRIEERGVDGMYACGCVSCPACEEIAPSVCKDCARCGDCCECLHCGRCGEVCEDTCARCDRGTGCCCRCAHCESCSEPVSGTCGRCDCCESCCDCSHCSDCGEAVESTCGDCDQCPSCCDCSSAAHIRPFGGQNNPRFHPAGRAQRKQNPSARFVAAEIEVASVDLSASYRVEEAVRKWDGAIVEDASLSAGGFEINTAPAAGDKFVQQIEEICGALAIASGCVDRSCGLHVHVDARDFSYYDVRRLVHVYAMIEPALFAMVSSTRRRSRYCRPCGEDFSTAIRKGRLPYKDVKKRIRAGVYGEDAATCRREPGQKYCSNSNCACRLRKNKYCEARYTALNLHSWFFRGTVECRLFGGTVKAEKIVPWGMLWARILDRVASWTDEEAEAAVRDRSPRETLSAVIEGDPVLEQFISSRIRQHAGG